MSRAVRHRVLALPVAALLIATLAGCGGDTDRGDGSPTIAAAFYPLAWVSERVGGDAVTVEGLTTPGGEPHDLELSIRQTALVSDAELVIHERGFQPAVDAAVEQNATGAVLDAAEAVELRPAGEHAGETDEEHAGHDDGELDPHFWLDPLLMADLGDAVAEELAAIDPDGATAYRERAATLRADLERLDGEYADGLARCERATVVVSHDAFGYLDRYGIRLEPILGLTPDAEPTASTMVELRELIDDEGITTVFSETLVSPETAQALAREAGVGTDVLDPIEGLSDATQDEDYLSLMRANLGAIQEANGC